MIEIRQPTEADRPQMIDMMRVSFNVTATWVRHLSASFRLDRFRCAFEGGRLVGMTQVWDLSQYFGGSALSMAGIAAVAAVPERRGEGIAPEVMREVLREQRSRGILVSTLYPSRAAVYRRLGYEYAGVLTQYRVPLAELPTDAQGTVEEMREDDLEAVRACYARFARRQHGCVESQDEDWWRIRVIRKWNTDVASRAVVVRGASGVEGYATFTLDPLTDTWGYRINCTHLVGTTPAAVRALLSYFLGFRGMGQVLAWYGPAQEPIGLLIAGGGESLQPARAVRFMTRLLDVPGALAARGYPPVAGSATIARVRGRSGLVDPQPLLVHVEGRWRVLG